jgi:hypothetical protein
MTYTPTTAQADTPIRQAIEIVESQMAQFGVHTVYEGRNLSGGIDKGAAVVCVVQEKGPRAQVATIPQYIVTPSGHKIPTDVVAGPPPKDMRLVLDQYRAHSEDLRRCFDTPIPGGAQIAPQNKNWVGTLGAAVKFADGQYGFITNEHVVGEGQVGHKMCQPTGNDGWIGEVRMVGGIRYDGPNYVDLGAVTAYRADGPYAPGRHLVKPEQYGLGKLNPSPVVPTVGMLLDKVGRTTGVTRCRVVGVGGTTRVGYDRGTALFRDQVIIEALSGTPSSPGDSGSLFVTKDLRPACLLFAGGGGQTIACRIDYVLDACKAAFFSV